MEQARQVKELQGQAKHLWHENDQLWAHIEKSRDLGKNVRDSGHAAQPIPRDKGKEPIAPNDVDTPTHNETSSRNSPSLTLSPTKNAWESTNTILRKRPSPHPTFSDVVNGASRRARRETDISPNRPDQAPRNSPVLPSSTLPPMSLVHPTFGAVTTFYILPAALIRRPDDILFSPLGQHILDYDPPHEFVIPIFTATDPYGHMLHYSQVMTLNADNDWLLWKVFPTSLRGLTLSWFHKLPHYSINSFNELWVAFISQYLCSVRQNWNISSLQTILK